MFEIPAVMSDYIAGLKTHDVDRIAATLADDLAFVTATRILNRGQFLQMLRAIFSAFPDWHYDHDPPTVRPEEIAIRWRMGGTHTATLVLPGLAPIPATGRSVTIPEHYFFYKVRHDHIAEIRPEPVPGGAPGGILEQIGAPTSLL